MELYEWLRAQPNRNEYMRELIRKDMQAHKQNEQKWAGVSSIEQKLAALSSFEQHI